MCTKHSTFSRVFLRPCYQKYLPSEVIKAVRVLLAIHLRALPKNDYVRSINRDISCFSEYIYRMHSCRSLVVMCLFSSPKVSTGGGRTHGLRVPGPPRRHKDNKNYPPPQGHEEYSWKTKRMVRTRCKEKERTQKRKIEPESRCEFQPRSWKTDGVSGGGRKVSSVGWRRACAADLSKVKVGINMNRLYWLESDRFDRPVITVQTTSSPR